jgi:hypothetical protein
VYLLLWRNWIAQLISTQWVGGSSPSRSVYGDCSSVGRALDCGSEGRGFEPRQSPHADIAQLVEHTLGKREVTSSILVVSSAPMV